MFWIRTHRYRKDHFDENRPSGTGRIAPQDAHAPWLDERCCLHRTQLRNPFGSACWNEWRIGIKQFIVIQQFVVKRLIAVERPVLVERILRKLQPDRSVFAFEFRPVVVGDPGRWDLGAGTGRSVPHDLQERTAGFLLTRADIAPVDPRKPPLIPSGASPFDQAGGLPFRLAASHGIKAMNTALHLQFAGTDAPVAFSGCADLVAMIGQILPTWTYREAEHVDPFLTIAAEDGRYTLTSHLMAEPQTHRDAVDAICAMIVELAWAHLRCNPGLLCLHGAAIEFGNKLVVIPNTRRAGKSTLTACLAHHGHKIFTDDFLPLSVESGGPVLGHASGIRPRLRLPLPETFSAEMHAFAKAGETVSNRRYAYLDLPAGRLARRGEALPIGAVVLLERTEDGPADIRRVGRTEALRALIAQNFSRALNAAGILSVMNFLGTHTVCYAIRYSSAEDAADLLDKHFATEDLRCEPVPDTLARRLRDDAPDLEAGRSSSVFDPDLCYCQVSGVTIVESEGNRFIVDPAGYGIHLLNDMSGAVWNVLAEPADQQDITQLFTIAFPDADPERISGDIGKVLRRLAANGLIEAVDHAAVATADDTRPHTGAGIQ